MCNSRNYGSKYHNPTDIVLITGPGAIGLMSLQVAKAYGAKVLISGTNYDMDRLEFAKNLVLIE